MDCDTEIYEPKQVQTDKVKDFGYRNVIIVQNNQIKQNFLFSSRQAAEHSFINLIKEFSDKPLSENDIKEYLVLKYFAFFNGFIQISKPIVKI